METIRHLPHHDAIHQARTLWADMLNSKTYPSHEQTVSLIANLQFAGIRGQLMADIPGIDEPIDQVLLAQTTAKPQWSRIECGVSPRVKYSSSNFDHIRALVSCAENSLRNYRMGYGERWTAEGPFGTVE